MWRRFLKLLFYIVLLLNIVFVATCLAVLRATEWHRDLLRFSYHVWVAFLAHVGSTGPGFISPIILGVLTIALTMFSIGFLQGKEAMLKHWWETALVTGVVLVTTMLLVYGPQFVWQVVRVARDDHRVLVSANTQLRNAPKLSCPACSPRILLGSATKVVFVHDLKTMTPTIQCFDATGQLFEPGSIKVVDSNRVLITDAVPMVPEGAWCGAK